MTERTFFRHGRKGGRYFLVLITVPCDVPAPAVPQWVVDLLNQLEQQTASKL